MKRRLILLISTAFAVLPLQAANTNSEAPVGPPAYARLKTLVGEWQADTSMGKVHVSYQLIAGGTALVERESGDNMPEMLTVYYLDAGRLLLTHYCMAGNQPRMQARAFNADKGEIDFQFLDATNLAPGAGHMHNAKITVADKNHLSAEWEFYENGQRKMSESAQYTRIK